MLPLMYLLMKKLKVKTMKTMYIIDIGYKRIAYSKLQDALDMFTLYCRGIEIDIVRYEKNEDGSTDYSRAIYKQKPMKVTLTTEQVDFDDEPF